MNRVRELILAFVVLVGLLFAPPAFSQKVHIGFLTGNSYKDLSESAKRGYVMGFVNGLLVAPLVTGKESDASWLHPCIRSMTDQQLVAIVEKYLGENPGRWQHPMNMLSLNAIAAVCPRK